MHITEIKEIERCHEEIVRYMSEEGIWKSTARRIVYSLCKSKTVLTIQFILLIILCAYFENMILLSVLVFLFNPCAVFFIGYVTLLKVAFYGDPTTLDMRTNMFDYWTRSDIPQMKLWVAETDKKQVGCIAIRPSNVIGLPDDPKLRATSPDKDTAILERMFIDSSCRGKGMASRLIQHAKIFCKEQGYREIRLVTSAYQPDAVQLYKKCGFKIDGVICILGYVPVYTFVFAL